MRKLKSRIHLKVTGGPYKTMKLLRPCNTAAFEILELNGQSDHNISGINRYLRIAIRK
jgi:hypothetical protein